MIPFALIPIVCLLLAAGCSKRSKDGEEGGGAGAPVVVEVKLDSLVSGSAEDIILATGRTSVLNPETVASPVGGKLLAMKVSEGQVVKAGQIVAVVRTKESESALEGARAMLREAATEAEKREAQHSLDLAEATQSTVSLRSKSGGTVAARLVQEGGQVAENESLLTLLDLATLGFQAEAPLAALGRIRVGQAATVTLQALPGAVFPARVEAISPQASTASQTLPIRLRFSDATGGGSRTLPPGSRALLKADMAGEARVVLAVRPNSLLAPKAALLRSDESSGYSLVTMGPDSLAHAHSVQTGAISGDRQEVAGEGLLPGMKVVVQGQYGLADSTRVRPGP